jgi:hypothetical protein
VDVYLVSLKSLPLIMWVPTDITASSKSYTSGRKGRILQDYVDLLASVDTAF